LRSQNNGAQSFLHSRASLYLGERKAEFEQIHLNSNLNNVLSDATFAAICYTAEKVRNGGLGHKTKMIDDSGWWTKTKPKNHSFNGRMISE
jgi:hypothetical protein